MKCPACKDDSPVADYGDPLRCPKCGAYYEKAAVLASEKLAKLEQERIAAEKRAAVSAQPTVFPHVKKIADMNKGAQPVVVVDLNMSFGSMVVFMIKWAIAAIPALIMLSLIGLGLVVMLGLAGGLAPLMSR